MYLNFSIATYISTQLGLKELSLLNSIFKQTSPATNTHLGGERINTIHHTVTEMLGFKDSSRTSQNSISLNPVKNHLNQDTDPCCNITDTQWSNNMVCLFPGSI